jgi:hypothetical protein
MNRSAFGLPPYGVKTLLNTLPYSGAIKKNMSKVCEWCKNDETMQAIYEEREPDYSKLPEATRIHRQVGQGSIERICWKCHNGYAEGLWMRSLPCGEQDRIHDGYEEDRVKE